MQELASPYLLRNMYPYSSATARAKALKSVSTKSIWNDKSTVFIRVFNSTSRKATPLHKQYVHGKYSSPGMTWNNVQASTRPSFPLPCKQLIKRKGVSHARLLYSPTGNQSMYFDCHTTWPVNYFFIHLISMAEVWVSRQKLNLIRGDLTAMKWSHYILKIHIGLLKNC